MHRIAYFSERERHRLARRKILSGELPPTDPVAAEAALSTGVHCALCELPVAQGELEFIMYFDHQWTGDPYRMHVPCYGIWAEEQTKVRGLLRYRLPPRPSGSWETLPS